ncbi:hypothetical protein ABMY26_08800 [Azospirillum sp. HJ39]|uniref:hypothetical protein n=1 Tax=Azospirillum sp. HJ39 TaxID=3159496 RepID=UPI003556818E
MAGLDEVTDSVTVGLPVDAALLKTGRYHLVMVRVTWGDDEPSPGDWVNTAAHPVRAGATPSPIVVPVHAIT